VGMLAAGWSNQKDVKLYMKANPEARARQNHRRQVNKLKNKRLQNAATH